jgi:hypothetical protein
MPPLDPIDIADEREYAWLLERSDTMLSAFADVWQAVPINPDSIASQVAGLPLRLLLSALALAVTLALVIPMFLAAAITPVAVFTLVEGWLPDWVWWTLIGICVLAMALHTLMGLAAYLHTTGHADPSGNTLPDWLREGFVAETAEPGGAWDPDRTQHVSHGHARRTFFAAALLIIGIAVQFAAVVGAERWFNGPVDSAVAWALFFARSLFDTAFLGIPSAILPPWSAIATAGLAGDLIMVAVDLFFAAGVLTLLITTMGTAFRPRELFHGTTRDLADYLHASDISDKGTLTIHRVAVLRPLDEDEVVTIGRDEFFDRVTCQG